jgi:hypothetical protein
VEACQEEYDWTPIFITTELHHGSVQSYLLGDVGDQAGIEDALPIVCRIKATIEVEIGAAEVQAYLCGHLLQRVQALW